MLLMAADLPPIDIDAVLIEVTTILGACVEAEDETDLGNAVDMALALREKYGERGLYAACIAWADMIYQWGWVNGQEPEKNPRGLYVLEITDPTTGRPVDPDDTDDPALVHVARFLAAYFNEDRETCLALWHAIDSPRMYGEFIATMLVMLRAGGRQRLRTKNQLFDQ